MKIGLILTGGKLNFNCNLERDEVLQIGESVLSSAVKESECCARIVRKNFVYANFVRESTRKQQNRARFSEI